MARDLEFLLDDMLDAARDAVRYASDLTQDGFELMPVTDRDRYRALKNAVTELGEVVKNLPADLKGRHPEVDWTGMAGVRDIVAHQYFRVDMTRLWPVLVDEFPDLISALEQEKLAASGSRPEDGVPTCKG